MFNKNQVKRSYAKNLGKKIIMQMSMPEMNLWNQFDSFFNAITKISSILKPKFPKPEKKSIINEQIKIIQVPELVYLPTNPRFKVQSIKLGSGRPMQSAAKCPIMVTFNCQEFEGPDKYFEKMKTSDNEYESEEVWEELFKELNSMDEIPINKPKTMCTKGLKIHDHLFMSRNGGRSLATEKFEFDRSIKSKTDHSSIQNSLMNQDNFVSSPDTPIMTLQEGMLHNSG